MNVMTSGSRLTANSPDSSARDRPARIVLRDGEGQRLQSGPGRGMIFKLNGDQTCGAFDYFIVETAPRGGPPLHVHHKQDETIHVLKGVFKVRIGDDTFTLNKGGFAYLPANVPHAFLNLTDEPGEVIVLFVPGGGDRFFADLAPVARAEKPDRAAIAEVFAKHDMTLLGPPLTQD
jgi:quercetin dioxygenase-like cupin family protein